MLSVVNFRWTAKRKAEIAQQIADGELGLLEAMDRYGITLAEFYSWKELFTAHGVKGLRTTFLHHYRTGTQRRKKRKL